MKVEEFQNLYKKEYGDDRYDLQIRLSAYDRHVSLCYVKLLIDNLKEDIDKKKNKLLSAWYKAHKCMNVRDSMVGFYWLSNEQLAWLVNNLDSLLELSEEELIFMTYLQHLTDEGISVLSSKMTHFPKKMLEENKEKIEVIHEYERKDKLEYLVEIELNDKLWFNRKKTKLIECFIDFPVSREKEKNIMDIFSVLSKSEQKRYMAVAKTLLEEEKYYRNAIDEMLKASELKKGINECVKSIERYSKLKFIMELKQRKSLESQDILQLLELMDI